MPEPITLQIGPAVVRALIDAEVRQLDAVAIGPMGGWRNEAVETVARLLNVNPYTLDRVARS